MAEGCLHVVTIGGWQTRRVADFIETIEGVKKVGTADGDSATLVVAIEREERGSILRALGRVSGVIRADLAE